jgi:hypothetical protein
MTYIANQACSRADWVPSSRFGESERDLDLTTCPKPAKLNVDLSGALKVASGGVMLWILFAAEFFYGFASD